MSLKTGKEIIFINWDLTFIDKSGKSCHRQNHRFHTGKDLEN